VVIFLCGHIFCYPCVQAMVESASKHHARTIKCPTCRERVNISDISYVSESNSTIPTAQETPPAVISVQGSWGTKIEALIRCIFSIGDAKSIIFSQWNDMLEIVSRALTANNIRYSNQITLSEFTHGSQLRAYWRTKSKNANTAK